VEPGTFVAATGGVPVVGAGQSFGVYGPPGTAGTAVVLGATAVVVLAFELADLVELEQLAPTTQVAASSKTSGLNDTALPGKWISGSVIANATVTGPVVAGPRLRHEGERSRTARRSGGTVPTLA
jgi:hypothetical protein